MGNPARGWEFAEREGVELEQDSLELTTDHFYIDDIVTIDKKSSTDTDKMSITDAATDFIISKLGE